MKEKYELVLNLLVFFALFCCLQTSTQASNLRSQISSQNFVEFQPTNPFDDEDKILAVCQSTPKIPGGWVVIGQGNVDACRNNSVAQPLFNAWYIKKPAKVEQVCQGSPLPDNYIVSGEVKIADCPGGSSLIENKKWLDYQIN